jgi:CRISPR-associated endoribonuclease Cas2
MKGDLRVMWLIVFFDLPVVEEEERKAANQFRQFLKQDGFLMLQLSVYARICYTQEAVDKHLARVRNNTPEKGSIRALTVTDKQYARMEVLLGKKKLEESIGSQQLLFF